MMKQMMEQMMEHQAEMSAEQDRQMVAEQFKALGSTTTFEEPAKKSSTCTFLISIQLQPVIPAVPSFTVDTSSAIRSYVKTWPTAALTAGGIVIAPSTDSSTSPRCGMPSPPGCTPFSSTFTTPPHLQGQAGARAAASSHTTSPRTRVPTTCASLARTA
jgi:hypothetical protein